MTFDAPAGSMGLSKVNTIPCGVRCAETIFGGSASSEAKILSFAGFEMKRSPAGLIGVIVKETSTSPGFFRRD